MASFTPAAVLWDLDGTLVDTEPAWMAGETALAQAHGAQWNEQDALAVVGMDLRDAASYMREHMNLSLSNEDVISELGHGVRESLSNGIPWRPGATELFTSIANQGIKQALVTMSHRFIAQPVIDALDFQAVVTGDIVARGKPHPEPYVRAAEMLGVDPTSCLAIEDSPTGTTSANSAGCFVLAVPHMVQVESAPRRHLTRTLDGLTFEDLSQLFQQ